jgi:hypothetical protein
MSELLAIDVLLVYKILLGYEEALWLKKLEISHASQILTNNHQIFVLPYLSNYCCTYGICTHVSLLIEHLF